MKARLISAARDLMIGLALTLCAMLCAALLIVNLGSILSLFGADQKIVSVVSQLRHANLILPWRLLITGSLVLSMSVGWIYQAKRRAIRTLYIFLLIFIWLSYFIFMLLGTSVNQVPVHTVLRILIGYLQGGALSGL